VRKGMLENGGSGLNTGWELTNLFFFSNSVEKTSLIVKKCPENSMDRLRNGKLRRRRRCFGSQLP